MAAKKTIRTKAGKATTPSTAGVVQVPLNTNDLLQAVDQLQRSVDELHAKFNAHTHGGVTVGAGSSGVPSTLIDGTAAAASTVFPTTP